MEYGSAVERWAANRRPYLDNLKVILIAAIIAGHGIVGYTRLGFWPYAEMRETTLSPVIETVLLAVVIPCRPFRWVGPVVRRSAYGAFVVQGLVLIGLAVALRPVLVPAAPRRNAGLIPSRSPARW